MNKTKTSHKLSVVEQVILDLGGTVINLEKSGKDKIVLKVTHGFDSDARDSPKT